MKEMFGKTFFIVHVALLLSAVIFLGMVATISAEANGTEKTQADVIALEKAAYGPSPSYTKPKGAVDVKVGQLSQEFIDEYPAGTKFWIRAGVHRLAYPLVPNEDQEFHGEFGAVLSGSVLLSKWTKDGSSNRWYATGQTQRLPESLKFYLTPGDLSPKDNPCAWKSEDIYIDNDFRNHVEQLKDVGTGNWFFDYDKDRIYIGEDPAGKTIEATVTDRLFHGGGNNVVLRNLVLEKAGSGFQDGAIASGSGTDWRVIDCEIRLHHGGGLDIITGGRMSGNWIHDNGVIGVMGAGEGIVFENNQLSYNNRHRINPWWTGGGTKWVYTNNLVVRSNWSHHNKGVGLWTDINNGNVLYDGNLSEYNDRMGIFQEIGSSAVIRNNVCRYNGQIKSAYNLDGTGITVMSSCDVEVYNNICIDNLGGGIIGIHDGRENNTGYGEPFELKNLYVHDNAIKLLANGQSGVMDYSPKPTFAFDPANNNRFQGNSYIVPSLTRTYWLWKTGLVNWTKWRSMGMDTSSSMAVPAK